MQQVTIPKLKSYRFSGQQRAVKRSSKVQRVKCVTEQEAATTTAQQKITTKPGIVYTHYESNTFTITFNKTGVTMLNDPWLVDDLYFGSAEWIFRAKKRVVGKNKPIDLDYFNKNTDFIHISQPISDHLHRPTMSVLDKSIPVVASVPAAEIVKQEFGYKNVTPIDHGESVTICDGKLTLTATQGALTGPPWSKRNNGIVIRENTEGGVSLYFEPHCDFEPESVKKAASNVDIVITPVVSQYLGSYPFSYPLVRGLEGIDELLEITKPKKILRLINGAVDQQGPLSLLIEEKGSSDDFEYKLKAQNSKFKGIEVVPVKQPGEEVLIELD